MKIIAHRGASFEALENSLQAIERAIWLGVDAIECDVHLSKDHVPVVIHDATLQRLYGDPRRVYDLDFKELEGRIPSLEQVLKLDRKGAELMIELKAGDGPKKELARRTLNLVKGDSTIILASFCLEILQEIRRLAPQQRLIGIMDHARILPSFRDLKITHFAISKHLTDALFLKQFHAQEESVWVWTVDDSAHGKNLIANGAKGIISNNPAIFIRDF